MSRRLRAAFLAAVLLGGPAGCATEEPAPVPPAGATLAPAEAGAELRLGLTEWSIETGGAQLLPGEVRVRVTNAGGTDHDVVIHGEQGTWASPVLTPGETHEMTITAVAGEQLHLVCTLTGHESQGMHTSIDVVEQG